MMLSTQQSCKMERAYRNNFGHKIGNSRSPDPKKLSSAHQMVKYSVTMPSAQLQKYGADLKQEQDSKFDTDTPVHHDTSISPSTHRRANE